MQAQQCNGKIMLNISRYRKVSWPSLAIISSMHEAIPENEIYIELDPWIKTHNEYLWICS
jgi:hypothetical protein